MGGIRIRCLRCKEVTGFELFMNKAYKACPHCSKEWNYANVRKTTFREY